MARVQYSNIINEINGSIGGLTFQSNFSGTIVRLKPNGKKLPSSIQTDVIDYFAFLQKNYKLLTRAQKDVWDAFAAANSFIDLWGNSKTITGANWYSNLNYHRSFLGGAPVGAPPAYALEPLPTNVAINTAGNQLGLTYDFPTFDGSQMVSIYATPPLSSVQSVHRREFLYMLSAPASNPGTITFTAEWEAAFNLNFVNSVITPQNFVQAGVVVWNQFTYIFNELVIASGN